MQAAYRHNTSDMQAAFGKIRSAFWKCDRHEACMQAACRSKCGQWWPPLSKSSLHAGRRWRPELTCQFKAPFSGRHFLFLAFLHCKCTNIFEFYCDLFLFITVSAELLRHHWIYAVCTVTYFVLSKLRYASVWNSFPVSLLIYSVTYHKRC